MIWFIQYSLIYRANDSFKDTEAKKPAALMSTDGLVTLESAQATLGSFLKGSLNDNQYSRNVTKYIYSGTVLK